MTDKEKLQKLFDAALRDASHKAGPPTRAFPAASTSQCPAPEVGRLLSPAPAVSLVVTAPEPAVATPAPEIVEETTAPAAASTMAGVLDDAASTELRALLDEQIRRKAHKHRIESLVAAAVMVGLTGGGFAWFVQSPERVQAFSSAIREIRSVGGEGKTINARSKQMKEAFGDMEQDHGRTLKTTVALKKENSFDWQQ